MELIPISRKDARKLGLTKYYTGKPCKHNHISERHSSNGECTACYKIRHDTEKYKTKRREWERSLMLDPVYLDKRNQYLRTRNKREDVKLKKKEYKQKNKDRILEQTKEYLNRPEVIIQVKQTRSLYKKKNKDLILADTRWRQLLIKNRIPAWADREKIKEFYKEAKILSEETGIRYHVDHIIPLNSEIVSGLHVEYNLRVIPAIENLKKHNKLLEL